MQQALLLPPGGQGPSGLKAVLRERHMKRCGVHPVGALANTQTAEEAVGS